MVSVQTSFSSDKEGREGGPPSQDLLTRIFAAGCSSLD